MATVNTQVNVLHTAKASAGAPVTGLLVGDFVAELFYRPSSGSDWLVAPETINFEGEIGATGRYEFNFTPLSVGEYMLQVRDTGAGTAGDLSSYSYDVLTLGTTFSASYDDAFCGESDIEAICGLAIDGSSTPTSTETAGFARLRGSELMTEMIKVGVLVTPDAGSSPVDVTTAAGLAFRDLLRLTNAVGAGINATRAAFIGVSPERSSKERALQNEYNQLKEQVVEMARHLYDENAVETPYSTGEIVQPTVDADEADPFGVGFTFTGDDL